MRTIVALLIAIGLASTGCAEEQITCNQRCVEHLDQFANGYHWTAYGIEHSTDTVCTTDQALGDSYAGSDDWGCIECQEAATAAEHVQMDFGCVE